VFEKVGRLARGFGFHASKFLMDNIRGHEPIGVPRCWMTTQNFLLMRSAMNNSYQLKCKCFLNFRFILDKMQQIDKSTIQCQGS